MNESTIKIPVFELFVDSFTETWEGWNLRDFGCTRRLLREAFKEHASDKLRDEAFKAPQDGRYSHRAELCKQDACCSPTAETEARMHDRNSDPIPQGKGKETVKIHRKNHQVKFLTV